MTTPTRDLSLKHYLREGISAVTDVDSTLIASFRALLTRPGHLTAAYVNGDTGPYLQPFRLFLICNLVYFVAAAQFHMGVLTVPLRTQTRNMIYAPIARHMVSRHLAEPVIVPGLAARAAEDSASAAFEAAYDGATDGVGKLIVVALIPLVALVFQAVYAPAHRFYVEHLVFATHLVAFLLLALAAVGAVVAGTGVILSRSAGSGGASETLAAVVLLGAFSIYSFVAQRAVYGCSVRGGVIGTAILAAALSPLFIISKFILFLVTLFWIG